MTPDPIAALEAALFDSTTNVLSLSKSLGEKIEQVTELERQLQSLKDDSGDIICELEKRVEALDAELRASAANVLSLSASLGKKIERVTELEAENERLRDAHQHDIRCYREPGRDKGVSILPVCGLEAAHD